MDIIWNEYKKGKFSYGNKDHLLKIKKSKDQHWWWGLFYKNNLIEKSNPEVG